MQHKIVAKHPHSFGMILTPEGDKASLAGEIVIRSDLVRQDWLEFSLRTCKGEYLGSISLPILQLGAAIQEYWEEVNSVDLIDHDKYANVTE